MNTILYFKMTLIQMVILNGSTTESPTRSKDIQSSSIFSISANQILFSMKEWKCSCFLQNSNKKLEMVGSEEVLISLIIKITTKGKDQVDDVMEGLITLSHLHMSSAIQMT
jgi:hypothetical protein